MGDPRQSQSASPSVDRALGHGGQHDWFQPAASSGLPSLNDAMNGLGPRGFLRLVRKRCGTSQLSFLSQTTAVKTTIIGRELTGVHKNPRTEFLQRTSGSSTTGFQISSQHGTHSTHLPHTKRLYRMLSVQVSTAGIIYLDHLPPCSSPGEPIDGSLPQITPDPGCVLGIVEGESYPFGQG